MGYAEKSQRSEVFDAIVVNKDGRCKHWFLELRNL